MFSKHFLKMQSARQYICKRINKLYFSFLCFIFYSPFAFADFASLGNQVKGELKSTASTVMSVLNTVVASVGIVYVCIVGFIFIFKPDTFKENSKVLIGALVALGALYGITNLGQSAFI
ncbi:hypothetical protein [Helicobacter trogontum]|uniref:Uncharacterized protein n=1 Tax=Helicobacter trogontum TaxID=50960 RepID=A0A099VD75_9HELI|nr:hypothetical protein [Helicobacter trogontum]TLD84667.1 hypothetical protein LS81_001265 [Helicobacter trogontum]